MAAPAQPSAEPHNPFVRQLASQHATRHAPTGQPAVDGAYGAALAGNPAPLGAAIDPNTVRPIVSLHTACAPVLPLQERGLNKPGNVHNTCA